MIWRGSQSLKELSDIFAGVLYTGYGPPGGFCWDQFCHDDPVQVPVECHDLPAANYLFNFIIIVETKIETGKCRKVVCVYVRGRQIV